MNERNVFTPEAYRQTLAARRLETERLRRAPGTAQTSTPFDPEVYRRRLEFSRRQAAGAARNRPTRSGAWGGWSPEQYRANLRARNAAIALEDAADQVETFGDRRADEVVEAPDPPGADGPRDLFEAIEQGRARTDGGARGVARGEGT